MKRNQSKLPYIILALCGHLSLFLYCRLDQASALRLDTEVLDPGLYQT